MGLGGFDLSMFSLLFVQIVAMTTVCCSFYFKYQRVYQKLYGKESKKGAAKDKAKKKKKNGKK